MSKSNAFETDVLAFAFNATAIPLGAATDLFVALHTADPGEAGTQDTNETAYTSYARVAVARTSSGWTVAGNSAVNAADIVFPQCGTTGATLTHWSIGRLASGAGQVLYKGALAAPLAVSNLIAPRIIAGQLNILED
jgi:hypothetical protein